MRMWLRSSSASGQTRSTMCRRAAPSCRASCTAQTDGLPRGTTLAPPRGTADLTWQRGVARCAGQPRWALMAGRRQYTSCSTSRTPRARRPPSSLPSAITPPRRASSGSGAARPTRIRPAIPLRAGFCVPSFTRGAIDFSAGGIGSARGMHRSMARGACHAVGREKKMQLDKGWQGRAPRVVTHAPGACRAPRGNSLLTDSTCRSGDASGGAVLGRVVGSAARRKRSATAEAHGIG